jgi:hypothetical protein
MLVLLSALQGAPQPPASQAQPRFPVDPATGRAIGATEMAPDVVKQLFDGQKAVIIDVRPVEAFEKETLPGAINIPLADLEKRLSEFSKDTTLVFT